MIADGDIVLITGIMASGKSTVAQALAERIDRSVHLRGDVFRRMIVNGRAAVTPDNWDEAERQLHLRYALAAQAALTYAGAGFTVVYQDVILGPDLQRVIGLLASAPHALFVVVLAPRPEVAAQRDIDRTKTGYGDWTAADLDEGLHRDTPRRGLWLDTSDLTAEETVAAIIGRAEEAKIR